MFVESPVLSVFAATDFRVSDGVAMGDALSPVDQLVMDDVYELEYAASPIQLYFGTTVLQDKRRRHDDGSKLRLNACLTLMTFDGKTHEVIVLTTTDAVYFLPLQPIDAGCKYRLIASDTNGLDQKFSATAGQQFGTGEFMALADTAVHKLQSARPMKIDSI